VRSFGTLVGTIAIAAGILIASSLTTGVASIAHSQGATPWPGFADVVDKIKPAVVSVRTEPERTAKAGKGKLPPPSGFRLGEGKLGTAICGARSSTHH
jgi:S1-C subfamily serine protease